MKSGILTNVGKNYITQCVLENKGLDVKELVLAFIPNLNESAVRDPNEPIPTSNIVHRRNIDKNGFIDNNTVAWGIVLEEEVGDFDYNWVGLVTENGILLALDYIPLQRKRAGINNVHNRSFVLQFAAAAEIAQINIPAQSWMFDYSPRIDAQQRAIVANFTANIKNQARFISAYFEQVEI